MTSILHPSLNAALRVNASSEYLYIIQEKAVTDLASHTRRDRRTAAPSAEQLRNWCFTLAQAVGCLHKQGIIHADIKASNILLFADGNVRLSDFTLAVRQWQADEHFDHNVCTVTHRPLECVRQELWSKPLDIWSLACTYYEIAYGELLFPHQGVMRDKQLEREKITNCLLDWAHRQGEELSTSLYPGEYAPPNILPEFIADTPFNQLLRQMLAVEPATRLTISQVLSHPYFTGLATTPYLLLSKAGSIIGKGEQQRISNYLKQLTSDHTVQQLALALYRRTLELRCVAEELRATACCWLASKLVLDTVPSKVYYPLHEILQLERDICHSLAFRLHGVL
jgi:serine/threonine protein kinase